MLSGRLGHGAILISPCTLSSAFRAWVTWTLNSGEFYLRSWEKDSSLEGFPGPITERMRRERSWSGTQLQW